MMQLACDIQEQNQGGSTGSAMTCSTLSMDMIGRDIVPETCFAMKIDGNPHSYKCTAGIHRPTVEPIGRGWHGLSAEVQEINQMIVAFLLALCFLHALSWLVFIGFVDCREVNARNTDMCLWLLSKGASPDTPDRRTRTPLYHAVPWRCQNQESKKCCNMKA